MQSSKQHTLAVLASFSLIALPLSSCAAYVQGDSTLTALEPCRALKDKAPLVEVGECFLDVSAASVPGSEVAVQALGQSEAIAEQLAASEAYAASTTLYRKLIRQNRHSFEVMDYQLRIIHNTNVLGVKMDVVRELLRAVALFKIVRDDTTVAPEQVEQTRGELGWLLSERANTYHREAHKTRDDVTWILAGELYKVYLENYPDSRRLYMMTFFYGELLYKLKKYGEAAVQYDRVIELDLAGQHTQVALYAAVLSHDHVAQFYDLSDDFEWAWEREPTRAWKIPRARRPLTKVEQGMARAFERYIKHSQGEETFLVGCKYSLAYLYLQANDFNEGLFWLKDIIKNHPQEDRAIASARILLNVLLLTNAEEEYVQMVEAYRDDPFLGHVFQRASQREAGGLDPL